MRFVCRSALFLSLCAFACARSPQMTSKPSAYRNSIAGDWTLTELGGHPAPAGALGQRPNLRLNTDSSHVSGFAGCNRIAGGFTVEGQNLHFATLAMTKMACTEGMELEQQFADALAHTNRYELTPTGMTFFDGSTPVARFIRPTQ